MSRQAREGAGPTMSAGLLCSAGELAGLAMLGGEKFGPVAGLP